MDTTNIEQELQSLLNKLTAEIETDQRQAVAIQKRLESNMKLKHALQSRLGASNSNGKSGVYGSNWGNIRNAVKSLPSGRFTQADIEAEMQRQNPDIQIIPSRLRTALWTLQSKHDTIKQVKKGDNQSPAEYERINGENDSSPCPPRRSTPPPRKATAA